jgi:hypothetical protein
MRRELARPDRSHLTEHTALPTPTMPDDIWPLARPTIISSFSWTLLTTVRSRVVGTTPDFPGPMDHRVVSVFAESPPIS